MLFNSYNKKIKSLFANFSINAAESNFYLFFKTISIKKKYII